MSRTLSPPRSPVRVRMLAAEWEVGRSTVYAARRREVRLQVSRKRGPRTIGHALYAATDLKNWFSTTASNNLMKHMSCSLRRPASRRPHTTRLGDRFGCGIAADDEDTRDNARAVRDSLLRGPVGVSARGRRTLERHFACDLPFEPVLRWVESLGKTDPDGSAPRGWLGLVNKIKRRRNAPGRDGGWPMPSSGRPPSGATHPSSPQAHATIARGHNGRVWSGTKA
jgi:hypothetical protein